MQLTTRTATTALAVVLSVPAALAPAGAAPAGHAPSAKAGAFTVTVSVDETEPELGDRVTVKGKVKPAVAGAEVSLQVKYDGRGWKTIDHDRLNATGTFRFKDKVGSVRERRYRVVKPAGGHRAAGRATSEKVTVFGWRKLISLQPIGGTGFTTGSVDLNGTTFPDSLLTVPTSQTPFEINYNLNHDCKRLRGTFGLDDRSAADGTATMSLTADGAQKFVGSFALTQSQAVTADITDVFRIRVATVNFRGGFGAVGTPEVLCSF
jgi:hypothetical protein